QPRPRLPRGDARRQGRARRLAATGTGQPMPLVFDDLGLDLGEFPHLMTQRRGVLSRQLSATAPAGRRLQGDDLVALCRGEERTFMPGVAGLTTRTAGRLGLGSLRLGVGVFGTGRQRGVAWGLVELFLQLPDRGEEGADDGLGFRGLAGNQLFGDLQRHALHVGEKQASGQTDSPRASPRAVADYPLDQRALEAVDLLLAAGDDLAGVGMTADFVVEIFDEGYEMRLNQLGGRRHAPRG